MANPPTAHRIQANPPEPRPASPPRAVANKSVSSGEETTPQGVDGDCHVDGIYPVVVARSLYRVPIMPRLTCRAGGSIVDSLFSHAKLPQHTSRDIGGDGALRR